MASVQKENDFRLAAKAQDAKGMLTLLDGVGPADRSDALVSLLIDVMWDTNNPGLRNGLAIALADMRSDAGAEAIRSVLRRPDTRNARGTLLYALSQMEQPIDLDIFTDTVMHGSIEAAEQCIEALEDHRILSITSDAAIKASNLLRQFAPMIKNKDKKELLDEAINLLIMTSSS